MAIGCCRNESPFIHAIQMGEGSVEERATVHKCVFLLQCVVQVVLK